MRPRGHERSLGGGWYQRQLGKGWEESWNILNYRIHRCLQAYGRAGTCCVLRVAWILAKVQKKKIV
jgi:hypothetical protein